MDSKDQYTQEFRSATEFPKTIDGLDSSEADLMYREIRAYLVRTNRSQGQLKRYNNDYRSDIKIYKTEITELQNTTSRLQLAINSLAAQKQEIFQEKVEAINLLEEEIGNLSSHLDTLSNAFDGIVGFDSPNAQWGSQSFTQRVFAFLKSVRQIVQWWRRDNPQPVVEGSQGNVLPSVIQNGTNDDRIENPRMHTDPASINRALRDDTG
ncbi:hypothetical protein C1752_02054 [Acaryochloris thomasi RCC1774]|uniref:Uncharacterized protein n=1 Tax=Acaryochloris thomasi RCC1774 TaxID=1764569 RepID=A0A2W1JJH7_9CYAN|nr:hypothetical protein [Acaryochloris thomasi]PZD73578.1 hypothetical protein C1752_02054 [Acaryochloris thomasi RCC1774]